MKLPEHEKETKGGDGQQEDRASVEFEKLTESMKELKLFPKLEHRQRHLKQVLNLARLLEAFITRTYLNCYLYETPWESRMY